MQNWPESKRWQCPTCLDILTLDEIWQQPGTGATLCRTCFFEWDHAGLFGALRRPDPSLCEECGRGMLPLETVRSSSHQLQLGLCASCVEIPEEEANAALVGMLSILEETDEDG